MSQSYSVPVTGNMVVNKSKPTLTYPDAVPLDSDLRTEVLHPLIQSIRLPKSTASQNATLLHPITLRPFTAEELKAYNFVALKNQYRTPEDAIRAQEDAIRELKHQIDENESRTKEISREMDDKEKTREIERKIYMKKLGKETG